MASNSVCSSCLRALRQRQIASLAKQRPQHVRSFTQRGIRQNDSSQEPGKRTPPPPRPFGGQQTAPAPLSDQPIPSWNESVRRPADDAQRAEETYAEAPEPSEPAFTTPQRSTAPPPPREHSTSSSDPIKSFAASVRNQSAFKGTTEPYIAYGSTEDLFAACASTCNYTIPSRLQKPPEAPPRTATGEDLGEGEGWWFAPKEQGGMGLDVTFNSWAQVLYLHMYVLTVRLRAFPAEHARIWHQNLLDHFFYAAEDRMATWHGMSARSVRNKYLKDIYTQWRGILFSYDEGLVRGDAVLASAVWRNVFKADPEVNVGDVALMTAYLRQELRRLEGLSDERLGAGDVTFGDPGSLRHVLAGMKSEGMRVPFAAVDEGVKDAVQEVAGKA